jgi:hypothetical protein
MDPGDLRGAAGSMDARPPQVPAICAHDVFRSCADVCRSIDRPASGLSAATGSRPRASAFRRVGPGAEGLARAKIAKAKAAFRRLICAPSIRPLVLVETTFRTREGTNRFARRDRITIHFGKRSRVTQKHRNQPRLFAHSRFDRRQRYHVNSSHRNRPAPSKIPRLK